MVGGEERNYDILRKLFDRIVPPLTQLAGHSHIQPTPAITVILIKMLAELLKALAFTKKEINETGFRELQCPS